MNSNVIIRRIDQSCDILGGENNLKRKGHNNVMGYFQIIKQLNEKDFETLWSILKELILYDGIYKDFALHLIEEGVLEERFFELDNELNPTENNINHRIVNELESDNSFEKNELYDEFYKFKENSRKIYEDNSEGNNIFSNLNLSKESEKKISKLKNKINPNALSWMQENIKNFSDEEFGNFMIFITLIRNGK
tara:strand:+ start:609 stop:1187 length:579 start_codon:yes stop_codon:yes gene_type:complete